jgi:hypothetical protein
VQAYRQLLELRKRLRLREQKAVEEAELVVQAKLIRMTDAKVSGCCALVPLFIVTLRLPPDAFVGMVSFVLPLFCQVLTSVIR